MGRRRPLGGSRAARARPPAEGCSGAWGGPGKLGVDAPAHPHPNPPHPISTRHHLKPAGGVVLGAVPRPAVARDAGQPLRRELHTLPDRVGWEGPAPQLRCCASAACGACVWRVLVAPLSAASAGSFANEKRHASTRPTVPLKLQPPHPACCASTLRWSSAWCRSCRGPPTARWTWSAWWTTLCCSA